MKLLMSLLVCSGMANASGISDDLNSVYNENAAAISSYTTDEKPLSNQSADMPPDSKEQEDGTVESNVLRGVKGIHVSGPDNSQISLEQFLDDAMSKFDSDRAGKFSASWTATKNKGFVTVKYEVLDSDSQENSIALWDVIKKDKGYCIQSKNPWAFMFLRGKDFGEYDSITQKYLCAGKCKEADLDDTTFNSPKFGLPCLAMEKLSDGHYSVKYPKVNKEKNTKPQEKSLVADPEAPPPDLFPISPRKKSAVNTTARSQQQSGEAGGNTTLRNSFERYPDFLNEEPNCSAILFMDIAQLAEYVAKAPDCNEPRGNAWFRRRFLKINNQSKAEGCAIRYALSNDSKWSNANCTINGEKPFICQKGVYVQLLVCPDDK